MSAICCCRHGSLIRTGISVFPGGSPLLDVHIGLHMCGIPATYEHAGFHLPAWHAAWSA